jgi:hypothetical protein
MVLRKEHETGEKYAMRRNVHELYFLSIIIQVMKSRKMGCMGNNTNAHTVLVGDQEERDHYKT